METLAIAATKGGVGKTTLAVHLAAAAQASGLRVVVFDLDRRGSAAQWGRDRQRWAKSHEGWSKIAIEVRRGFPDDLAESIARAEEDGFDFAIIDTPPQADYEAGRAVEVADVVLMPTRPGYFDLHAAKSTIAIVRNLNARAFFVVNQVPHNAQRIADDAADYLTSKGLRPTPVAITQLQPYMRALRDGLTAPELVPDGRHAQEMGALWAFLKAECAKAHYERRQPITTEVQKVAPALLDDDPFDEILRLNEPAA